MEDKNILRFKAKNLRKNLEIGAISEKLVNMIRENEVYKNSQNVMFFYPFGFEIDLRGLLSDGKKFYLPRVKGQNIEVCPYELGDKLIKSNFGVMEPISDSESAGILDLVIMPALMADKHGYRLGYGGGYYDRFLKNNKKLNTIVAIPKELYVDELPHEAHDVKADITIFA